MSTSKSPTLQTRITLGALIVMLAMALLAGGWAIPFQFESFSILYKFGKLKFYLRYGKVIGITVALLLFFQVVLASRIRILQQIFSAKSVLMLHRINGFVIACLVAVHPVMIKASESFTAYTFGKKYYPEFVGIGLLFVVLAVSLSALFRNLLKMEYKRWRLLHRMGATMVLLIIPGHVLFVSDTFKSAGLPRSAAIIIFSLNFLLIVYIWLKRFFQK
ncbi:ferric reductase-like transmembrane domain-containing protein [Thermodesulfobacteriota bacterium]